MSPVDTLIPTGRACPKCSYDCPADAAECPRCQVVFDRVERVEQKREEIRDEATQLGGGSSAERFAATDQCFVHQQVDRLEAFTGFEQANRYTIRDPFENDLFHVAEESNMWARQFLKSMRPFILHVDDAQGQPVLSMHRPYRFYFCEIRILDTGGNLLGTVTKRFSLVNRCYDLCDATTGRTYEIFGPFWKPWTFSIRGHGTEGTIRKKWGGGLREIFTDADTFGIEFPRQAGVQLKSVFLGALFLIDFLHFEDDGD